MKAAALVAVLALASCDDAVRFTCHTDAQCNTGGIAGRCVMPAGVCAAPSSVCASGYAYDRTSGKSGCAPVGVGPGQPCTSDNACASGHCVDSVCCESSCGDLCRTCADPSRPGQCVYAAAGAMEPHGQCTGDGSPCGHDGTCDGSGACRFPGSDVFCSSPGCKLGLASGPGACNGAGACMAGAVHSCGAYDCKPDGSDCFSSCTSGAGCATCYTCGPDATCKPTGAHVADARCPVQDGYTCGLDGSCDGAGRCEYAPPTYACAPPHCDPAKPHLAYPNMTYCIGGGAPCAPVAVDCGPSAACCVVGSLISCCGGG